MLDNVRAKGIVLKSPTLAPATCLSESFASNVWPSQLHHLQWGFESFHFIVLRRSLLSIPMGRPTIHRLQPLPENVFHEKASELPCNDNCRYNHVIWCGILEIAGSSHPMRKWQLNRNELTLQCMFSFKNLCRWGTLLTKHAKANI